MEIELKKIVKEFSGKHVQCNRCKHLNRPAFPAELVSPVQYGNKVRSLALYLNSYQLVPLKRCTDFFREIFGLPISEGSIINFTEKLSDRLYPFEEQLKKDLLKARYLHVDETGININKKINWVHTLSTTNSVLLSCHADRGHKALDRVGVLDQFKRTIVSDFYRAYWRYENEHLICHAHLKRELLFAAEVEKQKWAEKYLDLFERIRQRRGQDPPMRGHEIRDFEWEYEDLLLEAQDECPLLERTLKGNSGKAPQTEGRNLINRFIKFRHWILGILYDKNAPWTNNLAERDLRMTKVKQKISGCFRNDQSANQYFRIRSYLGTMSKRGVGPFEAILLSFNYEVT